MKIDLNTQFKEALSLLEDTSTSVFITGKAGTGKSTLLREFRDRTKKKVVVLAPTGVAAVNVAGETIHSFFGFKPGVTQKEVFIAANAADKEKKELIKKLDTIIIDEISMVRADLFDFINVYLQKALKSNEPFGGKQIIMIGDLLQLPPVITRDEKAIFNTIYASPYFFDSLTLQQVLQTKDSNLFRMIELEKIYRQSDKKFISLLNSVRNKAISERDLASINTRVIDEENVTNKNTIFITARNATASNINQERLEGIRGKIESYDAVVTGNVDIESFPAPYVLKLKKKSQVMLLNNDSEGRWINGSIGTIKKLDRSKVTVKLDSGKTYEIEPVTWDVTKTKLNKKKEVENEIIGSFKQLPVKLAWAITIHKSQGKTFDSIYIDLGSGAFAEGQTYVALSRATSMEGLYLRKPLRKSDIRINSRVKSFLHKILLRQAEENLSLDSKIESIEAAIKNSKSIEILYLDRLEGKKIFNIHPKSVEDFVHLGKIHKVLNAEFKNTPKQFAIQKILNITAQNS